MIELLAWINLGAQVTLLDQRRPQSPAATVRRSRLQARPAWRPGRARDGPGPTWPAISVPV